jgi:hypothetical protein
MAGINKDDLAKALSELQDLAKGHSSKGTNTTKVESMSGVGGATQVYHTPSNSEPGSWAGSSFSDVGENGAHDSVAENGTDYVAQNKMMKSILAKMAKGEALSKEEAKFYKGMAAAANCDDDNDADDKKPPMAKGKNPFEKKDEEKEDVNKSLTDFASEDEQVSKGLEVSEFLASFANVMAKSLATMEERITARIGYQMHREAESTGEFQKSLAGALQTLGEAVAVTAARVEQIEAAPARGPKSVPNVQVLEKGGFTGPANGGFENLSKSQISDALVDLVQKGQIHASEVLRFESTGEITSSVRNKVAEHVRRGA